MIHMYDTICDNYNIQLAYMSLIIDFFPECQASEATEFLKQQDVHNMRCCFDGKGFLNI